MKAKVILITYFNNGSILSQVAKEMIFQHVLKEMKEEGREVVRTILQPSSKSVTFTDGSKIHCKPASFANKGMKVTHIYADKNILNKDGGKILIEEAIRPCIMLGERANFDTSGKQFSFFEFDGELNID